MLIDNNKQNFRGGNLYNLTSTVQSNTLLNRGLVDIGGCAIPQALMSNNKDEAIERGTMSALYFLLSIVAPFFMLPFFNKKMLSSQNLVKDFKGNEKKIMEVSKKYLTKGSDYLVEGIKEKGIELDAKHLMKQAEKSGQKLTFDDALNKIKNEDLKLDNQKDFEKLLERFPNKDELHKKLAKVHENVLKYDFLSTAWMWCAVPYVVTGLTELRTHKKGFSAAFDMTDQTQIDEEKYKRDKRNKLITSALIATIPPLIVPKLLMKGISGKNNSALKKYASEFDYSKGMFMSKSIFAMMWALCDYPSALVASRDKNELKDRAIRLGALFVMFFGGDFAINNVFGRMLDKFAKTKIMNTDNISKDAGFFKRFTLLPRNFNKIDNMNIDAKTLKRTKNIGAALYWVSLLSNMALIGFALPAGLNKMLRKNLQKQNVIKTPEQDEKMKNTADIKTLQDDNSFKKFVFSVK